MARLLIVEDHPELASLMVAAAENRGHEATAVHTGEAALALVRPGAFEAAVVDLLLPDMRGSAVLTALRDNAIPAVAVSGVFKGDRFAREATEVHGARAFFEKPFELLHLLEFVEQLCGLESPPPTLTSVDEADEVVVFEDASLMELEDEPGFSVSEADEPLFAEASSPLEEARDPMSDERPSPTPPPLPPSAYVDSAPAFVRETPITLRTVELAGLLELAPLDVPDSPEEEPAPETPYPEELQELEVFEPVEAEHDEDRPETTAVSSEELQALESLDYSEQEVTPPATSAISTEELQALEALGPAEAPPATSFVSTEELRALENLGPTEAPPVEPPAAEQDEPEPGLALPFGEREKVWNKAAGTAPRHRAPPAWSLSGDLRDTSVPRLLNAYYEARHNGELKLRQGSTQKVIYFEAGQPVYAASNLAPERFLRFSVRRGVVPEAGARQALALMKEQNLRSGDALAQLGLMDARRRRQVLEALVKEVIWSTFSWTEGAYGFSALRPPGAGRVPLSVFPGDLILEGIQRTTPVESLREHMSRGRRLFPSAAPAYGLHELKLKGPQALLLAYADGSKTVEDLLTLSELPEREGLATLRGLELLGVLEERREEPGSSRRISFGL